MEKESFDEHEKVKGASSGTHLLMCAECGSALRVSEQEHVMRCELCGLGHKFLDPPETRGRAFAIGDTVAVRNGDHWWSAHLVAPADNGQWSVHYDGWAPKWNEVVGENRIRPLDYKPGPSIVPPPPNLPATKVKRGNPLLAVGLIAIVIGALAVFYYLAANQPVGITLEKNPVQQGSVVGPLGQPVERGAPIRPGQKFLVNWGDAWYPGTVISVEENGTVLIHYDGWDSTEDEFVTRERLRYIE